MIIKSMPAPSFSGRVALMLCDDEGEPFPQQVACDIRQQVGKGQEVTVTFRIDGKQVRIAG